jgi:hypothetical protein
MFRFFSVETFKKRAPTFSAHFFVEKRFEKKPVEALIVIVNAYPTFGFYT